MASRQIAPNGKATEEKGFGQLARNPLLHLLLIAGLAILCYANTFHVPFVFDGLDQIHDNPVVHGLANFFRNNSGYAYNKNRFVCFFTFALNYQFGGLDVAGYHLVNLAIHIASALLVYALVLLTFRTPWFQDEAQGSRFKVQGEPSTLNAQPSTLIPLVVALLFALHPVQTQAVTYIYQRLASLGTMFYLLALVLYVLARLKAGVPSPESRVQGPRSQSKSRSFSPPLLVAGSVLAAILAMKTKEFSVTLPFIALLYEFSFFRGGWRRRLAWLAPLLLTIPIVPLGVFLPGLSGAPGASPAAKASGHLLAVASQQFRLQTTLPRWDYLLTQFRVIVTYLRLLVLPVDQNLDYDYPVYSTFFTPPVFLSFLLLAGLFALAVYLYWRSRKTGSPAYRLIGFGILWFFVTLSVTSSVIPIYDVIFEHRLYLPFFGAAVAVVMSIAPLFERFSRIRGSAVPVLLAVLVISGFGFATYLRNQVWESKITMWQDVVQKSPEKVRPYNNLGASLNEAGRFPEAISVLSRALEVRPDHAEAWYNLGRAYMLSGRYGQAIAPLEKAIRFKPDYPDAFVNLGASLNRMRRFGETVALLENKLDRWGSRPPSNSGRIMLRPGITSAGPICSPAVMARR